MKLDRATSRRLFASARVARLATIGDDGAPHIVPIVFALDGDDLITAVDQKPKSTRRLRRLANIAHDARAAVLVDRYDDDWGRLWWVRADGTATIASDEAAVANATTLLAGRYPAYRESPPAGPVIRLHIVRWTGWAASISGLDG